MTDKQNIDTPHERRPFHEHGHMDVVTLGDFTLGVGTFEPGWRWSEDVKPIAGTDSCRTRHTGICLSGQMTVRLDDGTEVRLQCHVAEVLQREHADLVGRRQEQADAHRAPGRLAGIDSAVLQPEAGLQAIRHSYRLRESPTGAQRR